MKTITSFLCLALSALGTLGLRAADSATPPSPVLEVSEMGIWTDGKIAAWGNNTNGQTNVPTGLGDVVSLAAGDKAVYALRADGTIATWGTSEGSLPAGLTGVTAISVASKNVLALKQDGTLVTTDGNTNATPPAGLTDIAAIATSEGHSVALKRNGTVVAWGADFYHQATVPTGLSDVIAVAAGNSYSLALKQDGTLIGWGVNNAFSVDFNSHPIVATGLTDVVSLKAGAGQILVLKSNGQLLNYSTSGFGTTGLPLGLTDVTAITCSRTHSMALKQDGTVVAWNDNTFNESLVPDGLRANLIAVGSFVSLARPISAAPVDMGLPPIGGTGERQFRVTNPSATATVSGLRATVSTSDKGVFSIAPPLPATLAPGQVVEFAVRYAPNVSSATASSLSLYSDASASAFATMPLIVPATQTSVSISPPFVGGITVPLGSSVKGQLRITNEGTGRLTNISVTKSGQYADEYTLPPLPFASLPAGRSVSVDVTFTPQGIGARPASLTFASSASVSNLVLPLQGQGSILDITATGDKAPPLTRPSAIVRPSLEAGRVTEKTFTVTNHGSIAVTGLQLMVFGPDAKLVTVQTTFTGSLEPGASATFTVRMAPKLAGTFDATVHLASSTLEPAALIRFFGTVTAPQLRVRRNDSDRYLLSNTPDYAIQWGGSSRGTALTQTANTHLVSIATGASFSVGLKDDGTLAFWNIARPPNGLANITAITAGPTTVATLKSDGTVFSFNPRGGLAPEAPAGLTDVTALAVGLGHILALKRDGTVVAWGDNAAGQSTVPTGLHGVVAITAAFNRSAALKGDGSVVTWGDATLTAPPPAASLVGASAITMGWRHMAALKGDGTVVTWGTPNLRVTTTPADLKNVTAIAAGYQHTLALKGDGTVAVWGDTAASAGMPANLSGVTAISAFDSVSTAVVDAGNFAETPVRKVAQMSYTLSNNGTAHLTNLKAFIDGPDADQFRIGTTVPALIGDGGAPTPLILYFAPTTGGAKTATLHITSNDPVMGDFILPLRGIGVATAVKAGVPSAPFTYRPTTLDKFTGLNVLPVSYLNTSKDTLNGLRLVLSNVPADIQVRGSSAGERPGTLEVLYTNPIKHGQTVAFDLTYFDPRGRNAAPTAPIIKAEPLEAPEPQPGPVRGTLINLLGVRDTQNGPLLEWNTVRNGVYVVEYSDDKGANWHAAVHRLGTGGTRMLWVDRGQPETQTKPANKAARLYRVKKV